MLLQHINRSQSFSHLKPNPSNKVLIKLDTPTEAEIELATSEAHSYSEQFSFLVMLKPFKVWTIFVILNSLTLIHIDEFPNMTI